MSASDEMSQSDEGFQDGPMRNEGIAFPQYFSAFLDDRSAAPEEELPHAIVEEPQVVSDEEAELRAVVSRRLLEKLGILSEVEELFEIAQRNRAQT